MLRLNKLRTCEAERSGTVRPQTWAVICGRQWWTVWSAAAPPVPTLTLSLLISHSETDSHEVLQIPPKSHNHGLLAVSHRPTVSLPPRFQWTATALYSHDQFNAFWLLCHCFWMGSMRPVYICKYTICCGIFTDCFFLFFLDVLYVSVTSLHLLLIHVKCRSGALLAGGAWC